MNSAIQPVMDAASRSASPPATADFQGSAVASAPVDGEAFRAALERHMQAGTHAKASESRKVSMGEKLIARASDLASETKKDHEHVSKMIEQATRNGDSMQLVKAMMALNDYEMRVQFISKVSNKATSSIDRLTTLQ